LGNAEIVVEQHFGQEVKVFKERPNDIYGMFQNNVSRFPEQEAVILGEDRLTYRQLDEMVKSAAAHLQKAFGFKQGDRLGVLSSNRIEFCVSIFAAAALGGIIVPLNTRLHYTELQFMMADAGIAVLVVEDELLGVARQALDAAGMKVPLIVIDGERRRSEPLMCSYREVLQTGGSVEPAVINSDDPLFIMYTSGTTGRPKGAIGTHIGVIQNLINFSTILGTDHHDRTLVSVPLFHVTGFLADFLHMMYVGGTAVLMRVFKTRRFLELLEKEKITYLVTVPTIYVFILNHPEREKYDLSRWRLALYGGAPMAEQTIREMLALYPHMQLINTYGATECSGSCTLSRADKAIEKAASVGLFEEVVDWKIIDENGRELPRNQIGEICIKGVTVVPGYWNNPEATEKAFIDGYWRSGDLGYVDDEGFLYIMDRKKEMINRGGEKIYCIELENVLYSHPKILEAAVVGVPDRFFGEEVLAAVVLKEGEVMEEQALRDFIAAHLADYKVPKYIKFVDQLPRNPAGKVIKQALKETN
jgi:acyl-CoA synthetase (AMP-forming)/AMP-acid ligase II